MFMDKKFRNLLFAFKIQGLKKLLYTNHLCNNGGKIASYDGGTYYAILLLTQMRDFDTLAALLSYRN